MDGPTDGWPERWHTRRAYGASRADLGQRGRARRARHAINGGSRGRCATNSLPERNANRCVFFSCCFFLVSGSGSPDRRRPVPSIQRLQVTVSSLARLRTNAPRVHCSVAKKGGKNSHDSTTFWQQPGLAPAPGREAAFSDDSLRLRGPRRGVAGAEGVGGAPKCSERVASRGRC